MTFTEITAYLSTLAPNDLLKEVKDWQRKDVESFDKQEWLASLVKKEIPLTKDTLPALRTVLFFLSKNRVQDAYRDTMTLFKSPEFASTVQSSDWLMSNMNRIIPSLAKPSDVPELEALVTDSTVPEELREQCFLSIHFMWLEKVISAENATEIYRRIIQKILEMDTVDSKMATALAINSAVVGGKTLSAEIAKLFDKGFITEHQELFLKAIQAITNDPTTFRNVYRKEHKGYFNRPENEILDINSPIQDQNLEMPGKGKTITREAPKIGRNDPCPCGSGKKYKKCCGK